MPEQRHGPIEFVVWGTPKSAQSKGPRDRWKAKVRRAAPAPTELLRGPLRLRIDFFFDGVTQLDVDNIIKPIADALEEVIYDNDKTIVEVRARKFERSEAQLLSPPAVLLQALDEKDSEPFVLVRVDPAPREASF